ncbi:MAG: GNAT family N-acetyltransferase [Ruminococcaceae bacterium]|nr:GNAT family N-acetyltransferase [Oscillospiraceae bacterium]
MISEDKTITLKDGRSAILKSPCVEDAERLLNCVRQACGETDFLVRYPEEWTTTVEQEAAWIDNQRSSPNTMGIACYVDGNIVGNCDITFNSNIKTAHRASVSVAVLKDYWNLGIGSAMFDELVDSARTRNISVLELDFAEGNDRAQRLYEKFGFCIVSQKPYAFRLKDGTFLSEIHMQKHIDLST